MTERATRFPCPVCLSVMMDTVRIGEGETTLEIDHCTRCGGVWFDAGEVERLREFPSAELWARIGRQQEEHLPPCHLCHAPLSRHEDRCAACGWKNLIDCPVCDSVMDRTDMVLVTLDVCRSCKGVWFDHFELDVLWETASFAAASMGPGPGDEVAEMPGGAALDAVPFAAAAAGPALIAADPVPGRVGEAPEAAVQLAHAAGEAAGAVFDIIAGILAALFERVEWDDGAPGTVPPPMPPAE